MKRSVLNTDLMKLSICRCCELLPSMGSQLTTVKGIVHLLSLRVGYRNLVLIKIMIFNNIYFFQVLDPNDFSYPLKE